MVEVLKSSPEYNIYAADAAESEWCLILLDVRYYIPFVLLLLHSVCVMLRMLQSLTKSPSGIVVHYVEL